jgi:hypothetical protein
VKKRERKNPHAVALGRLGGLVRSEAKKRANKKKRPQGRPDQKPQEEHRRQAQRSPAAARTPQERVNEAISSIHARFGKCLIGRGCLGIRYVRFRPEPVL